MKIMKPIVDRLSVANPGWSEWGNLIALVKSLTFETIEDEHLGTFYSSDYPLVFSDPAKRSSWPSWLPLYVPGLFGMKADDWEMAGGYADSFSNELAVKGAIFSPAGNDEQLGYPLIDVAQDVYYFQSNNSGALFFINKKLEILYPNSDNQCFEKLDVLEGFSRTNIRQALRGAPWFEAYGDLKGSLLD
jgi:hypothetical protein